MLNYKTNKKITLSQFVILFKKYFYSFKVCNVVTTCRPRIESRKNVGLKVNVS